MKPFTNPLHILCVLSPAFCHHLLTKFGTSASKHITMLIMSLSIVNNIYKPQWLSGYKDVVTIQFVIIDMFHELNLVDLKITS